jgi:hypothetical protein
MGASGAELEKLKSGLEEAVKVGYRHFDTVGYSTQISKYDKLCSNILIKGGVLPERTNRWRSAQE